MSTCVKKVISLDLLFYKYIYIIPFLFLFFCMPVQPKAMDTIELIRWHEYF